MHKLDYSQSQLTESLISQIDTDFGFVPCQEGN